MPSVLITGVSSFTGLHLARYLDFVGFKPIFGCDISEPRQKISFSEFLTCDIGEPANVASVFDSVTPDLVFHLAGSSDDQYPAELIRTNVAGAWNLLDRCRQQCVHPSGILLVGSAAGYGAQLAGVDSLGEDMPAHPSTFYGFSREAELTIGRIASEKWGMPVFLCRTFNLIGPGLSERYAPAAILRRLLDFKKTGQTCFSSRDGSVIRDFIDVRDAVRAYTSILTRGRAGVIYNVGSGHGVSIEEITLRLCRLAEVPVSAITQVTPDVTGRSNSNRSIANIRRLSDETGWHPEVLLEQSLSDMVREMTGSSANHPAGSSTDAKPNRIAPLGSE